MLARYLGEGATERALSTKPFIDNNPQRILITGRLGFTLELLGCHISRGANNLLSALVVRTLRNQGHAKIAEPGISVRIDQHILWFNVAMDQLIRMGVL